jgi:hypothetical protein
MIADYSHVSSCTYGSTAKRMTPSSYAKHLEQRIAELEVLLKERSLNERQRIMQPQEALYAISSQFPVLPALVLEPVRLTPSFSFP